MPVQVPSTAVRVEPSAGVPVTLGDTVFTGGAAVTATVGLEAWLVGPPGFVAVTTTTIAWSMSLSVGRVVRVGRARDVGAVRAVGVAALPR